MDEYAYIVNVDGAVVRDDEYLLIERGADEEHAPGMLAFPGGKVETSPGETYSFEVTARRELREEVGIEVGEVEYVLSNTFEADDGTPCLNVVTLCEYERGEAHPRASDEVAAVHWLTAEEIRERDAPEFLVEYVERLEEHRHVK
ncbi:NUDIX domain-containing protein [Haloferax namakaokahaiae]|uniref:NUDIX domain-containing protein n=1 Tax=Haloferax namakaokahaiae TaxID=1748331 RepID=A0ABD5ZAE3_9EURY